MYDFSSSCCRAKAVYALHNAVVILCVDTGVVKCGLTSRKSINQFGDEGSQLPTWSPPKHVCATWTGFATQGTCSPHIIQTRLPLQYVWCGINPRCTALFVSFFFIPPSCLLLSSPLFSLSILLRGHHSKQDQML